MGADLKTMVDLGITSLALEDRAWPQAEVLPDGLIAAVNSAFAASLDQPPGRLAGSPLIDWISPQDREAGRALLAAPKGTTRILRFVGGSTGIRTFVVTVEPRPDGSVLLAAQDVSALAAEVVTGREATARLRDMMFAGTDIHWETDPSLRKFQVTYWHTADGGLTQRQSAFDVMGGVIDISYDPDGYAGFLADVTARRPFREFVHRRIRRADGNFRYMRTSGSPFFTTDGKFAGYRGSSTDVTAEVEAVIALRESEKRFRDLFEAASDWYFETDDRMVFTHLSPNFAKCTGIPVEALLGRPAIGGSIGEISPSYSVPELPGAFRDVVYRLEVGAAARWVKASGTPFLDSEGRLKGFRGMAADITAQVEAEGLAKGVNERLIAAFENIAHPLAIYDRDERLFTCNRAYRDLHRKPDETTLARPGVGRKILHDWRVDSGFYTVPPALPDDIWDRIGSGNFAFTESMVTLSDGREMLVDVHATSNDDSVVVWTDVTELRHAERQRRDLEMQLQHSQRLESLGTLAGGIAHDLNNTLVPVLALSKFLAKQAPVEGRFREQLDLIHQAAARGRDLVKQILAFSRKEAPEMREVDLPTLVREALSLLRATVPASIKFIVSLAQVPPVLADAGQLHQVLLNLVTNAAQAIGAGTGTISVAVAVAVADAGAQVRWSVADSGCGMDMMTQSRIFEPFFTTRATGDGTGLGLSVVHGIIANHGGTIGVASEAGQGTRFDILLPIAAISGNAAVS